MIYDYLIIGAGISGTAAGYELARYGSVLIVEAESRAGYNSTGCSAARYAQNYGPADEKYTPERLYQYWY